MAVAPEASPPADPTGAKRWLFTAFLAAVPLAVFATAELAVRLVFGTPAQDDPYLNLGAVPPFFRSEEIGGVPHLRPRGADLYRAREAGFPLEKPADGLRIFTLGGSASAGWPHPAEETYGAYLRHALQRAFPDRAVEVRNASAHAHASYRVRAILDEVLDYAPDLLLLYTGNNEFLERRDYGDRDEAGQRVVSVARRSALYQLLRYFYLRWRRPESTLTGWRRDDDLHANWSKVERVALDLRTDPEQYAAVKAHYRFTIGAMLDAAAERGVPVVVVTVPVNLREWWPNVSVHGVEGVVRDRWRRAEQSGRRALLEGDGAEAVRSFGVAAATDGDHAETRFLLARAQDAVGDVELARANYLRAKDLDANPFRADSAFNVALRELAAERPGAHLVDLEAIFLAEVGVPGLDLMLDYVHPSKRGNALIARSVYDAIVSRALFGSAPEAPPFTLPESDYDELRDETLQATMLWVFGMMHQYETLVARAEALRDIGLDLPVIDAILDVFPAHLELERRRVLGLPVDPARERAVAEAMEAYYAANYRDLLE